LASDYQLGSMDIKEQANTFDAFVNWAVWGIILVALGVFGLVLVFGTGMNWYLTATLMCVLAVLAGFALKLPTIWHATIGGIFVLASVGYFMSAFVGMFI
jgi:Bacterial aa3 type cytochrome c oxidase subunit IV